MAKLSPLEQLENDISLSYQKTSSYLIKQAGTQARANFLGLPDWRDDNVPEFLNAMKRDLIPLKKQSASFAWGYMAQIARARSQEFRQPKFDPDQFETAILRNGSGFDEVFRRPFVEMRSALAQGRNFSDALYLGGNRASSLAQTEVQLNRRQASLIGRSKNNNIVGYLRVLSGAENCALCYVASTQRYRKGDLLPIHPGCDCGEMPIYGNSDPGQVIDEYNLERAHQAVEDRLGVSARDARQIDYRALTIHEHGELGPVLTIKGQDFTGPGDLTLIGSKIRRLDEAPVPLRDVTNPYLTDPVVAEYGQDAVDEAERIMIQAAVDEPPLTAGMQAVAKPNKAELSGLDFRLKGRESMARKIANDAAEQNIPLTQAAAEIGDAVRYTMVSDINDYAETIRGAVAQLESEGYEILKFKNYWQEGNAYKGMNLSVRPPGGGRRFELQFHTPDSLATKDPSHDLYEKSREAGISATKKAKLEAESRALWAKVDTPQGLGDLGEQSIQ